MLAAIGPWEKISLLVVLGLAAGCGGSSSLYSVDTRDVMWSSGKDVSVGGIDTGTVAVVTLKSSSTDIHRLVLWGDVSKSRMSGKSNRDGAWYQLTLETPDGRQIGIAALTHTDDQAGLAVIQQDQSGQRQVADLRSQLTDDTIFLVSTANNKVTVKQLQGGVEAFTSLPELKLPQIQELLKSRPEIQEFFEAQHTEASAK